MKDMWQCVDIIVDYFTNSFFFEGGMAGWSLFACKSFVNTKVVIVMIKIFLFRLRYLKDALNNWIINI